MSGHAHFKTLNLWRDLKALAIYETWHSGQEGVSSLSLFTGWQSVNTWDGILDEIGHSRGWLRESILRGLVYKCWLEEGREGYRAKTQNQGWIYPLTSINSFYDDKCSVHDIWYVTLYRKNLIIYTGEFVYHWPMFLMLLCRFPVV